MTPRPERRSKGVGSRVSWPRSPAPSTPDSSASPPSQAGWSESRPPSGRWLRALARRSQA
eukprot:5264361-Alexandrium_andersonii.AAC.1